MNDYEFVLHGNCRLFVSVRRLTSQQWTGSKKKKIKQKIKTAVQLKIQQKQENNSSISVPRSHMRREAAVTSRSPPIIPTGMASFNTHVVTFQQRECRRLVKKLHQLFSVQVNRDLLCLNCFKGLNLKGLLRKGRHGAVKR